MTRIRIATRASPLAMWQAYYVRDQLMGAHPGIEVEIIAMTTSGDRLSSASLASVGGKGLFMKELEQAMLAGKADLAVHSMKDVPVTLPDGLVIGAVCPREDPCDALVSNRYPSLSALPEGASIGTSSLRRASQLRCAIAGVRIAELRGNVNTRLKKLDDGEYDAVVLAAAGLRRLGLSERIAEAIDTELCLPAVGQGIVGIECRADDDATLALLGPLQDVASARCLEAERSVNQALGGGCHVPIAAYAEISNGALCLRARVAQPDGSLLLRAEASGPIAAAGELGARAADELQRQGAADILRGVYAAR